MDILAFKKAKDAKRIIDEITVAKYSTNLYDKSLALSGWLVNNNSGTIGPYDISIISGLVPVQEGNTYIITNGGTLYVGAIHFLSGDWGAENGVCAQNSDGTDYGTWASCEGFANVTWASDKRSVVVEILPGSGIKYVNWYITDTTSFNYYGVHTSEELATILSATQMNLGNILLPYEESGTYKQVKREAIENLGVTKEIKVTLDSTQSHGDVAVRTRFNDSFDLVTLYKALTPGGENRIVNFAGMRLITLNQSPFDTNINLGSAGDDATPINVNGSYIGGNHGHLKAVNVVMQNHGKTFADIGSEWVDSYYKWYLLKIVNENTLLMISQNIGNDIYDFRPYPNQAYLTHVSGAVNTADIVIDSRTTTQLTPAIANRVAKIFVDDKEVTANGTYTAYKYVDIVNDYDIINPSTVAQALIENRPPGGYTENPDLGIGQTLIHYSVVYRTLPDGTITIYSNLMNYLQLNLDYWGVIQHSLPEINAFGGSLEKYIPKTLPITKSSNVYEFRTPRDMTTMPNQINITSEYWENPTSPPDRTIDLLKDAEGVYKAGFAVGYLPIADGAGTIRAQNVNDALMIYTSKKSYPRLYNGINPFPAESVMEAIAYRKWYPIEGENSCYVVENGNDAYVYLDYFSECEEYLNLDKKYMGRKIEIVEKSNNVSIFGTIVTNRLRIKVSASTPMYGYVVLKLTQYRTI